MAPHARPDRDGADDAGPAHADRPTDDDGTLRTSTTPVTTDAPVDDPEGLRRPRDVDPLTGAPTDREAPTR